MSKSWARWNSVLCYNVPIMLADIMHKNESYQLTGWKYLWVSSEDKCKKLSCIAVLELMIIIGNSGERNKSFAKCKLYSRINSWNTLHPSFHTDIFLSLHLFVHICAFNFIANSASNKASSMIYEILPVKCQTNLQRYCKTKTKQNKKI